MLKTITPQEMKALEASIMQATGVSSAILMERAATYIASAVSRLCQGRQGLTCCLCGTGNNGGDGLAAMRLLASSREFEGICWVMPGELSPDAAHQLNRLRVEQPQVQVLTLKDGLPPVCSQPIACVVDALLGTGLSRPMNGLAKELCGWINQQKERGVPVLAVDIPSGLDGSTGAILGAAVQATETVTFHRPKPGLYLKQGLDCSGSVTVGDIGLPAALDAVEGFNVLEPPDIARLLPPRRRLSHKGSYGRALLWCGSRGMAGAAAICATAALRAGAGLVTVACGEELVDTVQTLCPCATCLPLPQDDEAIRQRLTPTLEDADALGLGCGLGQGGVTPRVFGWLLNYLAGRAAKAPLPTVIDADGLNLLAMLTQAELHALRPALEHAALTPHPAEAARLLGSPCADIVSDPVAAAMRLHEKYGAAIILKGAASILVAPEGVALNTLGSPAMAKGGSGDALTGVLTALLAGRGAGAYPLNTLEALQAACGLHGLAGMEAEKKRGQRGVLATDLCDYLGTVG